MKKISIIVPVYNSEKYLSNTIKSILNQTLNEIELILINDGSKDKSEEIIQQYKKKYPTIIKTKTIKNSGAANARNVGLMMAEGEYVGFVDSDDYIEKNMYEKLYQKAKQKDSDIAVCGYYIEKESDIITKQIGDIDQYGKSVFENPELFICGVPYIWNKIFRRELIEKNDIKFKKLKIFEDLEYTYIAFLNANKIEKVNEPLYYYRKENENSLTAKFSIKFFDIFEAIKNLKEYCIQKNIYQQMEKYILFIALNHIHLRFGMKVKKWKEKQIKGKYISESFEFLNKEFPKWKNFDEYYTYTKRNKKLYTKKIYAELNCYTNLGYLYLKFGKLKKVISKLLKPNLGYLYWKYSQKYPIDEKQIMIDSQHGNDINGNMFYLIKELVTNKNYQDYEINIGIEQKRKSEFEQKLKKYQIERVNLIIQQTKMYAKKLATAKYLFSDTSFPAYYIKRKGQIYLNTWHGTPLKTLGRSTKYDFYTISNLQRNFAIADYLLYPNQYMMQHMLKDYMINNITNNKILLCGYPRNSIFFDKEREKKLREELNLEDKTIITYMPTWRGFLYDKDINDYIQKLQSDLQEIGKNLKDNQILYVNVHPYVKDYLTLDEGTNIRKFPTEYETYDFLNLCDILITDYSSVFFDFAIKQKKIILYTYDEEKYFEERGVYLKLEELPFKKVKTIDQLIEEINNDEIKDNMDFIQTYCNYEDITIPKKICEKIILQKKNDLTILEMPNNQKKNILIFLNHFSDKEINKEFFKILERTEKFDYNYYISFVQKKLEKYNFNLVKLPEEVKYIGRLGNMNNTSYWKRFLIKILKNKAFYFDYLDKEILTEKERAYGQLNFDKVLMWQEKDVITLKLFENEKIEKILYSTNKNIIKTYKNIYDKIIENIEDEKDLNDIFKD